jgi:hypothetical protein
MLTIGVAFLFSQNVDSLQTNEQRIILHLLEILSTAFTTEHPSISTHQSPN